MPYTPPSHNSPVSSRPETPSVNRTSSFTNLAAERLSYASSYSRPTLPRSASSTAYLHKHRRSPSAATKVSSFNAAPSTPDTSPREGEDDQKPESEPVGGSAGRHPPQTVMIPTSVGISPPDSAQCSSDEEVVGNRSRGGRELHNLAELQAAIRVIGQHRKSSPNRANEEAKDGKAGLEIHISRPESVSSHGNLTIRPPLSPDARRISHSRSSTESSPYFDVVRSNPESPRRGSSGSEEDDDLDDYRKSKPAMVRKKSGELVRPALRPASAKRRPSSMPGTPTFSKAVHFDSHLEHVRHFLQVDQPLAVSAGSSPVEFLDAESEFPFQEDEASPRPLPYEWEIRLSNFPSDSPERRGMPIRVEKVFLSVDNKHLIGSVIVANLAFRKLVVARFTLDYWKTTSEVVAAFNNDVRQKDLPEGHDRFSFDIKLADQTNLENKTLFFCVRYSVNGQEHWDSNNGVNFQVDFVKKLKPRGGKAGVQALGARPLQALPHSKPMSNGRPRSMVTSFDDFADGWEPQSPFSSFVLSQEKSFCESPIRLKAPKPVAGIVPDAPGRRSNPPTQAFGNRYDFGASLSAAIQASGSSPNERGAGQSKDGGNSSLGRQTSATARPNRDSHSTQFAGNEQVSLPVRSTGTDHKAESAKPVALTSGKPSLQSQSYHDLLDKYCFFGSAKTSPQIQKPVSGQLDGAADDISPDHSITKPSAASPIASLPHGRAATPPVFETSPAKETRLSPIITTTPTSRSASPATGLGRRAGSPGSFGYPYRQPMQNSFFTETFAATAIRG